MPSGLIEDEDGVGPGRDLGGYFFKMPLHGLCITTGQDESHPDASTRADGAKDPG